MKNLMNATVTVRLDNVDKEIIARYARAKGQTVSEVMRTAILDQIEDEYDLELYRQAIQEFRENPISYSLDEVAKLLETEE